MSRPPSWEPVWQGNGEAQAHIVAGGLRATGINVRIQGARQTQALPHAFQRDAWALFVPLTQAASARAILRGHGEEAGVVDGSADRAGQRATLGFAAAFAAACLLVVLALALRQGA
jgi:hypothetical protein